MEVRYFDTSVILSLLFSDSNSERALELWEGNFARVSSRLLQIECWVNVHKYAALIPDKLRAQWKKNAGGWLQQIFSQFYFYEIDASITSEIAANPLYGQCRTLDAVHIASAGIFSRESDAFSLVTFDRRMQEAAAKAALKVIPASHPE